MRAAGQEAEHVQRLGPVGRLAEHLTVEDHGCIGPEHGKRKVLLPHGLGLGAGHALNVVVRALAGMMGFVDVGARDDVRRR